MSSSSAGLGVAIYGAGNVSSEHIRAYIRNPNTRITAICSRTLEGAAARAAEFDLQCKLYDDYEQMLADSAVDIVSICTPHYLHAEGAVKAARAGKHILIEKPIALTLAELREVSNVVTETGVKSVVSFVLRWNPLVETLKALITDDAIGQPVLAEVDYWNYHRRATEIVYWANQKKTAGSALLTAGCHAVDTVRWLLGSEATEVTAYSTSGSPTFEFDPTITTIARFDNGCVVNLTACLEARMPYIFNINILGLKGAVRNNTLFSHKLPGQTGFATIPTVIPDTADVAHHPFQAEIDHLVECVLQDVESHVNVADAVRTHEFCMAADLSAETGRTVKLPLVDHPTLDPVAR